MKVVINGEKEYQAEKIAIASDKIFIKCSDENNYIIPVVMDSDVFEVRGNERTLYIDTGDRIL